ncbi:hypothetical protein [Streptomyces sp. NBC_01334]|uniref:hypothetical protein n=1 Tax=Streptomyces sp. NBC_01334 TaxID=2903827 RepID=UPI002E0DD557|nr:hypothetical protein OG736_44595 [Streptomyces sp. NBC_01334]
MLAPAALGHPWTGWTFSAGWGSRERPGPAWSSKVGIDVSRDNTPPGGIGRAPTLTAADVPHWMGKLTG